MLAWAVYLLGVSAVMSLAGFGLERAIRPYGRPTRWIWVCALCGSLLLPVVLASTARPDRAATATATATSLSGEAPLPSAPASSARRNARFPDSPRGALPPLPQRLDAFAAVAWAASSGVAVTVLLAGGWYGRRRRRGWRRASVAGTALLVASDAGPATIGLLHPQIVVPEWLLGAAPETLRLVIAHERSHVEARDPALLAFGLSVAALMPWNVLLWWHVQRLRLAIEVDCDRRVLRFGHDARRYARALVDVGTRQPAYLPGVAAAPGSASSIERRIVLMNTPRIHGWRAQAAACALLSIGAAAAVVFVAPPAIPQAFAGTAASVEATGLERYVGDYELSMAVLPIRLRDGRLEAGSTPLTLVSGQLFRYGNAGCCSPDSDAYLRFATDAGGRVIGAVLQQNGIATEVPRIDAERARAIDRSVSDRVREQRAAPGSEAALRQLIVGIESGEPPYAELSPQVAGGTRAMLTDLQTTMKPWGALRSIEFRGVNTNGWDKYLVRFERGAASWELMLDPYGVIVSIGTSPGAN